MALEGTNDATSAEHQRPLNRRLVLERLAQHRLARISLDFDGSVLSTHRHAEGTARDGAVGHVVEGDGIG